MSPMIVVHASWNSIITRMRSGVWPKVCNPWRRDSNPMVSGKAGAVHNGRAQSGGSLSYE